MGIDKSTQEKLVASIEGLPPLTWLNSCKTTDQIEHWKLIRQSFQITHLGLKEYFAGQPSTIKGDLAIAQRAYYLSLYNVIQQGWRHIRIAAEEIGIENFPDNPGQGLIKIIELDCAAFFFCPLPQPL